MERGPQQLGLRLLLKCEETTVTRGVPPTTSGSGTPRTARSERWRAYSPSSRARGAVPTSQMLRDVPVALAFRPWASVPPRLPAAEDDAASGSRAVMRTPSSMAPQGAGLGYGAGSPAGQLLSNASTPSTLSAMVTAWPLLPRGGTSFRGAKAAERGFLGVCLWPGFLIGATSASSLKGVRGP